MEKSFFFFYLNRSRITRKTAQKCFNENVKWKRASRNDDDKMYVSSCLQKNLKKKKERKKEIFIRKEFNYIIKFLSAKKEGEKREYV